MQYTDPINRTGLVQLLEDLTSTQSATTSSYPLATKTRDINLALDEYFNLVKRFAGTWQADDSNHVRYPNMKFNLVSGQQDYSFTEDEQGNQVQDIYRVECMDENGKWQLLQPVDEMSFTDSISEQETQSGTPNTYYKTANGIFLVLKPNYSQALGIRMWFTRSPNYFLTSDTTKEAGITNAHNRYIALKPAFWYWLPKDTQRANLYKNEITQLEKDIAGEYANRKRDESLVLTPESVNPF